jgi:hypothetical protein
MSKQHVSLKRQAPTLDELDALCSRPRKRARLEHCTLPNESVPWTLMTIEVRRMWEDYLTLADLASIYLVCQYWYETRKDITKCIYQRTMLWLCIFSHGMTGSLPTQLYDPILKGPAKIKFCEHPIRGCVLTITVDITPYIKNAVMKYFLDQNACPQITLDTDMGKFIIEGHYSRLKWTIIGQYLSVHYKPSSFEYSCTQHTYSILKLVAPSFVTKIAQVEPPWPFCGFDVQLIDTVLWYFRVKQ